MTTIASDELARLITCAQSFGEALHSAGHTPETIGIIGALLMVSTGLDGFECEDRNGSTYTITITKKGGE